MGGVATETALLARLRAECARRARGAAFRRAVGYPQSAATALLALLSRVNGDLYATTASHDDYVTAACSLTAVLVVAGRAYTIHAGATAAYLVRAGEMIALCADDVLDERLVPLLGRSFVASPALDVAVSTVELVEGDLIALLGQRVDVGADGRATLAHLEADPAQRVLLARFERDEVCDEPAPAVERRGTGVATVLTRLAAAAALALALVYGR